MAVRKLSLLDWILPNRNQESELTTEPERPAYIPPSRSTWRRQVDDIPTVSQDEQSRKYAEEELYRGRFPTATEHTLNPYRQRVAKPATDDQLKRKEKLQEIIDHPTSWEARDKAQFELDNLNGIIAPEEARNSKIRQLPRWLKKDIDEELDRTEGVYQRAKKKGFNENPEGAPGVDARLKFDREQAAREMEKGRVR